MKRSLKALELVEKQIEAKAKDKREFHCSECEDHGWVRCGGPMCGDGEGEFEACECMNLKRESPEMNHKQI